MPPPLTGCDAGPGRGLHVGSSTAIAAESSPHDRRRDLDFLLFDWLKGRTTDSKRHGKPHEFAQLVETMITVGYFNGASVRLDGAIRMGAR